MARSTAARRGAGVEVGTAAAAPPVASHPTAPAVLDLVSQAHRGLSEAATLAPPHERFATAHLAALRAAAAVLAVKGRPEKSQRRRRRIRSAWEVLPEAAPELREWSTVFAAGAPKRARAEAGIPGAVTQREADDLIRAAGEFLRLVERLLTAHGALPPAAEPDQGHHHGRPAPIPRAG